MAKVANVVSKTLNTDLEVTAYMTTNQSHTLVFLESGQWVAPMFVAIYGPCNPPLTKGEFIVVPIDEYRPLIEEIRNANIFIDTGRRIQVTDHLWSEVWKLKNHHITLIEEESRNETQSGNQPEHRHEGKR